MQSRTSNTLTHSPVSYGNEQHAVPEARVNPPPPSLSLSITMTQYECLLTYLLTGHFLHSLLRFSFSSKISRVMTRSFFCIFCCCCCPLFAFTTILLDENRVDEHVHARVDRINRRERVARRKEQQTHYSVHHLITGENNAGVQMMLSVSK